MIRDTTNSEGRKKATFIFLLFHLKIYGVLLTVFIRNLVIIFFKTK